MSMDLDTGKSRVHWHYDDQQKGQEKPALLKPQVAEGSI